MKYLLSIRIAGAAVVMGLAFGAVADEAVAPAPVPSSTPAPTLLPARPADVEPLAIGTAPGTFKVRNAAGEDRDLKAMQGEGNGRLVVIFYRGGWCPYCNTHLAELKAVEKQIEASGAHIVAMSMDRPDLLAAYEAEKELPFPLYSDSQAEAAKAFGVAYRVSDEEVARLGKFGIDLEVASGESHHILPVPSVFVIGPEGTVTFEYHNADYRKRISTDDLLKALEP